MNPSGWWSSATQILSNYSPELENTMPTTENVIPINAAEKLPPPTTPGAWTLAQIQEALKRPLPKSLLATRIAGWTASEIHSLVHSSQNPG
jgi:hypothetical protein